MSAKPAFRRRRYLIKRGLQFRYIGIVFVLVVLTSILTGYTVFATGWTLLGSKLASVYPQGRLIYVFKAANIALARNLLLVSPFIFIIALLSSHKIAGPVYRIEKTLEEIGRGNLNLRIKFRRGDELWDVAELINTMTENLKKTMGLNKGLSMEIKQGLDDIKKAVSSEPYDRAKIEASVSSLQAKLTELNSSLDRWTL